MVRTFFADAERGGEALEERSVAKVGRGASIAVAVETMLFAATIIVGKVVRSGLGPMAYADCILLAASIVVMMAAVCLRAPDGRRSFGLLALSAAIIYAPFCMGVYFVQIAVVARNPLAFTPEALMLITFIPGSPMFALDMLGYAFLCLSTLAAAFTFSDPRDRALRILCIIHGFLALPTLAAPILSGVFSSPNGRPNDISAWVLLSWCAIFTPIPLFLAKLFHREYNV